MEYPERTFVFVINCCISLKLSSQNGWKCSAWWDFKNLNQKYGVYCLKMRHLRYTLDFPGRWSLPGGRRYPKVLISNFRTYERMIRKVNQIFSSYFFKVWKVHLYYNINCDFRHTFGCDFNIMMDAFIAVFVWIRQWRSWIDIFFDGFIQEVNNQLRSPTIIPILICYFLSYSRCGSSVLNKMICYSIDDHSEHLGRL